VYLNSYALFNVETASGSAFCKARQKISAEAFIELNDVLVTEFYSSNKVAVFNGLTAFAIDGYTVQLPESQEVIEKYGCATNQTASEMVLGRVSQLYDIENKIIVHVKLAPYNESERHLAMLNLEKLVTLKKTIPSLINSIIIFDRGYQSVTLMLYMLENGIDRTFMQQY
jgi:hypothetical protein